MPPVRALWIIVQMPEAPVHKNHFAARGKYEVGLAGQIGDVQPVTETHPMNEAAHEHFRFHALALDAPHIFGAALKCQFIRQIGISLLAN